MDMVCSVLCRLQDKEPDACFRLCTCHFKDGDSKKDPIIIINFISKKKEETHENELCSNYPRLRQDDKRSESSSRG